VLSEVKVVSNASPLISLARIGHLDTLRRLYDSVHISTEVYNEVVIAGTGLPGAAAVSNADWIHKTPVRNAEELAKTIATIGLGAGEVSTVFLAKELPADLTLMDEWKGRRLAIEQGLAVVGCIGILEELYRRGEIKDLRENYQELLRHNIRVDLRTLQGSLKHFGLAAL
jgi:predicted nucleic acid-binding protein